MVDKDTVVRWSAAKGLGRITGRLPRDCGSDVVQSVIKSVESADGSPSVWHGTCLALAECSRRGLILREHLSAAIDVVLGALTVDAQVSDVLECSILSIDRHR